MAKRYEPEIGQAIFGCPSAEYECPEYVRAFIEHILYEIDRVYWNINQKDWDRYDDPKIPDLHFRPYYWGECDCGFDEEDGEWCKEHEHSASCFHTRYSAYENSLHCSWEDKQERLTKWAKANGYEQAPFGMAVYCDCGHDADYAKWRKTHNHKPDCSVILPNLKYGKAEIRWYKHPGRGMSVNVDWNEGQWRQWLDGCLECIRRHETKLVWDKIAKDESRESLR